MNLFFGALIVFAITLTINKSSLLECKREFVKKRYEASWVAGSSPGYLHWVWHAWWTCPMCLGFWVSCVVGLWCDNYIVSVFVMYSLNWLIHCVENFLVTAAKFYSDIK